MPKNRPAGARRRDQSAQQSQAPKKESRQGRNAVGREEQDTSAIKYAGESEPARRST
jgi:hypothetical protein